MTRKDTISVPDLRRTDTEQYDEWHRRRDEVAVLVPALFESLAFERLGRITFLGILSPRFANCVGGPMYAHSAGEVEPDGSRASHSLGVALVALDMLRPLRFSEASHRYAAAWALLHDIGNWPLAHTGEYAFSRLLGVGTRQLREMIVLGDPSVPPELHLDRAISSLRLEPEILLHILRHDCSRLTGEYRTLCAVLGAAINPDVLEGMWRASRAFGSCDLPHPTQFTGSLLRNLWNDIDIHQASGQIALKFWRGQRKIYRKYINRPAVMLWESAWSRAILREFEGVGLGESLWLSEDQIVGQVLASGLPPSESYERYKPPIDYVVEPPRKRTFSGHAALADLATVLTKRRLELAETEGLDGR